MCVLKENISWTDLASVQNSMQNKRMPRANHAGTHVNATSQLSVIQRRIYNVEEKCYGQILDDSRTEKIESIIFRPGSWLKCETKLYTTLTGLYESHNITWDTL